ncbi:tyrosine-type recombinase/integrase [Limibaculum sp. FT325]|uniref:tyrosine-type recombinase/integrase n=1 Tax=Thermohalobaculum sediminis TaxID=2939436 RepID=UPI0020BF4344|nr:site-specific integrase [Limibaculum sediminis]MCL5779089.1 tyrosine-type recombinase/integrase [Limibaculum sediminis]
MRPINKLTDRAARTAAPGKYNDGAGLWLVKRSDGGAQWVVRIAIHGRRREMGLGSLSEVSLKEAREAARSARAQARSGVDPIRERQRRRREAEGAAHTLAEVTSDCFAARKSSLKNEGKAARWMGPLECHVLPRLGEFPVAEIDQNGIRDVLGPIWHEKPAVAKKAIERLGVVLRHAAALGLDVDIQAVAKAKALLGKPRHEVRHYPSLPWPRVPEFYASLGDGATQLAMRLLILTAARSGEIRLMREEELSGDLWIVPAERMKGGIEHRVPLSDEALRVVEAARQQARNGYLFPGQRAKPISDMTLTALMKRRGMEERPHGFRSSFRTWCAEATDTPREIAETALAHVSGGKVELSYRRTDYLEHRRALMQRWADHVTRRME